MEAFHDPRADAERGGVGEDRSVAARALESRTALEGHQGRVRGDSVGLAVRSALEGPSRGVPKPSDLLASAAQMGGGRDVASGVAGAACVPRREGSARLGRGLHGRQLFAGKKRGPGVGNTRKGKGTKWMVVGSGEGVPLGVLATSASPSEMRLAEPTLDTLPPAKSHADGTRSWP